MSLACKCDRCGKLYERYRDTKYGNANGFQFCRISSEGIVESRLIENDLCPKCMEELKGWFKNELVTVPKSVTHAPEVTYDDIYKDFIKNKWNNNEFGILNWRPGEKAYTIKIWATPGIESTTNSPIYIYNYNTKELILEDPNHDTKTSV